MVVIISERSLSKLRFWNSIVKDVFNSYFVFKNLVKILCMPQVPALAVQYITINIKQRDNRDNGKQFMPEFSYSEII